MPTLLRKPIFRWSLGIIISAIVLLFLSTTSTKEIPPTVIKEATQTKDPVLTFKSYSIGKSVEGRSIEAYTFGDGPTRIVFFGGIHGGYEWNSVLLAYGVIDYLVANPSIIPKNLSISILPSINPDAIYKATGKVGRFTKEDVTTDTKVLALTRFNSRNVDLNRNFDCNWQSTSTWQSKTVSAGSAIFSEPESLAVKDFLLKETPAAVIFWHSKSNAVYASQCNKGILSGTRTLMNLYAKAADYPAIETFDAYVVTGAAEDWLASINIPAITVELKTHETIELEKNLRGVRALFTHYSTTNP